MSAIFINEIEIEDFRTFGKFNAKIPPFPGLTLVVGTNGLGKSSFFDAIEWGLTGEVRRFRGHLSAAAHSRHLTRRNAGKGRHSVRLSFGTAGEVFRADGDPPPLNSVADLLKAKEWAADITDIGTYLAFTHFLGQASDSRFANRERNSQWETLRGPSGIDRLEEVKETLVGNGVQMAFNRRISHERDALKAIDLQRRQWLDWMNSLSALKEASRAAGDISSKEIESRLDAAEAECTREGVLFANGRTGITERLSELRQGLSELIQRVRARQALLAEFGSYPARYVELTARLSTKDAELELSSSIQRSAESLSSATGESSRLLVELDGLIEQVRVAEERVFKLERHRSDLEYVVSTTAELGRLREEKLSLLARINDERLKLDSLKQELDEVERKSALVSERGKILSDAVKRSALASELSDARSVLAKSEASLEEARTLSVLAIEDLKQLEEAKTEEGRRVEAAAQRIVPLRQRATSLAAAVAEIASHIHVDDTKCPVCASEFSAGRLKGIAERMAALQDAELTSAEAEFQQRSERFSAIEILIEERRQILGDRDARARELNLASERARSLEATLLRELPAATADAVVSMAHSLRNDAETWYASAVAEHSGNAARQAEMVTRMSAAQDSLIALQGALESSSRAMNEREIALTEVRSRLGDSSDPSGDLNAKQYELLILRQEILALRSQKLAVEHSVRVAGEAEVIARTSLASAQGEMASFRARQRADAEEAESLRSAWMEAGLAGEPSAILLEEENLVLSRSKASAEMLEEQLDGLANQQEALLSRSALASVVRQMSEAGGDGAAENPAAFLEELDRRESAAKVSLEQTETAKNAAKEFGASLTNEASKFASKFLEPLNERISEFNDALLTTPGESIVLNAKHYKNRTNFDLKIRYKDRLEDAIYDTSVPPQVILSEGQLAANGFSILCSASTAYPWSRWRALLMDDPLQHNDIIHVASFVDLMRNMVSLNHYQLFMSTHDMSEAEFIKRKFDAAQLPCAVIVLTAPSNAGVRYLPARLNEAALIKMQEPAWQGQEAAI